MNQRRVHVLLSVAMLALFFLTGCASTRPKQLDPGRGLYWRMSADKIAAEGYPDQQHRFRSTEWGVLRDSEGTSFGPGAFLDGMQIREHPRLRQTEKFVESNWVRVNDTACCAPDLLVHMLEIYDLQYYELREILNFQPDSLLVVHSPAPLEVYTYETGNKFWNTHDVDGRFIVAEPMGLLFGRTLHGHVARVTTALAFLDMKCHGRLPAWFRVGLASYLGQEGNEHVSFVGQYRAAGFDVVWPPEKMLANIWPFDDQQPGRIARYNAFLSVWHLAEGYGFDRILELLELIEDGALFDEAVQTVYGRSERQLLELVDPTVLGEPSTQSVRP